MGRGLIGTCGTCDEPRGLKVLESHVSMRSKGVSTPILRSWPCLWSMEAFRTGLHLGELNRRLLIVETLVAI
jgi:hypothetical protein